MPIEETPSAEYLGINNDIRGDKVQVLTLPKRKMLILRIIGAVLCFASQIPLFIGYQFIGNFQEFFNDDSPTRYFSLIFAIAGLIPAIIGLIMFGLGCCMFFSRSRALFYISEDKLIAREKIGPFYKKWMLPRETIRSIQVVNASALRGNDNQQFISDVFFGILIKTDGSQSRNGVKEVRLAPFYTLAQLEFVAQRIAAAYQIPIDEAMLSRAPAETNNEVNLQTEPVAMTVNPVPDQPKNSSIEFEDRPDGLAIRVPPKGLIKGSKGLFFFAIFWDLFVGGAYLVLTALFISEGDLEILGIMAFLLIFAAVGVGVTLAAVNMGKRKADILLMRSGLSIRRSGIFGEKVFDIDLPSITSIEPGPSGMSVNDVPVLELHISSMNDKRVGLLSQLDNDELIWIAALLNNKLAALRR